MSDTHAQTVPFVRESMLPEQEPPLTEKGVVKWIRENMLSSWLNVILTILSVIVIYLVLAEILPWFLNSVWDARSLSECREVFLVIGSPEGGGACWAVLQERWVQLIYGFYPSDLYWRPNLALILFFVAVAPVLYADRFPSWMLWFTAIYPFFMPWLLWGGAFWVPILVIAGLAVGYLAFVIGSRLAGPLLGGLLAIAAAVLWWLFAVPALNDGIHRIVAEARMDTVIAETEEDLAEIPVQIDELEARRAVLIEEVEALEAVKAEAFAPISEAVEAARESAIAAFYEEAGLDPETDEISRRMREEAREAGTHAAVMATRTGERIEARERFLAAVDRLTELRLEIGEINGDLNLLSDARSQASNLLTSIRRLEEQQDRIGVLQGQAAGLRSEVPEDLRHIIDPQFAPADAPSEGVAALRTYREAQAELDTLNNAVEDTYKAAGSIGLRPVESRDFGGFMLALIIGLSGIILSLPLGILLALGRQSDLFIINKVSVAFIEIIRGVPLIVWLFTAQLLLNYFLPPGTNFDLLLRVIIMVTLFASAYIAEVVRGGLAALPTGQYEAADALGLDYGKSMRLVVLPQALKISIPGIVNTFIGLFKDTTLVVFIGLLDPIGLSNTIRASTEWNGIYWELFVFIGLLFFICCFSMGRYSLSLEKKLTREHR
ncbi:ABC glutamate/glutamine/aspartate/asparagine transporter, inner membrane subunit BztC [Oceanicola granulosus HTCC2516]|uniref:ABC glutamate/glutamine/aspartate/asparagine transporter, inner membrane subunit BztC n=1 Tax=Oceanicola granulosus (strain ATCC BAA-861 / DSM 15982 / KCTC 12143 / HTCC2516) TaxID=314256 RepID=Q2CBM0_OCEGH|nr:ABC glutamate/glutamine/aspartate/asparagine transporter, inner membrane subunit BztC [Oceanicola granulosus HTCC2516]